MKQLTDDLINKYIDNELTQIELEQVETILSENPEELKRLKAQKMVDESLSDMTFDTAPRHIASRIMDKITEVKSVKNEIPYFLYTVLGIFGAVIFSLIGYIIYTMPSSSNGTKQTSLDKFNSLISQSFNSLGFLSENDNIIIIGVALTIILLIGFFMMLNFQRHALTKLNSYSH